MWQMQVNIPYMEHQGTNMLAFAKCPREPSILMEEHSTPTNALGKSETLKPSGSDEKSGEPLGMYKILMKTWDVFHIKWKTMENRHSFHKGSPSK